MTEIEELQARLKPGALDWMPTLERSRERTAIRARLRELIGSADEVLAAFLQGRDLQTEPLNVPGGARLRSVQQRPGWMGAVELYSYRTLIAQRQLPDEQIAVTTASPSTSTDKVIGRLMGLMGEAGFEQAGDGSYPSSHYPVRVRLPGRMGEAAGGYAWATDEWKEVTFLVYSRA